MAALKYILVPEANFNSLLAKEPPQKEMPQTGAGIGDDLQEKSLFEFVKKRLGQAKKGKKKNASTKNVLFQQRLRSYLKARKALLNRPMKVQLEAIGKEFLSKYGPKNEPQNALLDENGELEPIEQVPKVRKPSEAVETFATASEGELETTPTTSRKATPIIKSRRLERGEKVREKEKDVETRMKSLANLIAKDPAKFGVGKDEQNHWHIINPTTKKPVVNSDIMVSISRIVNPTTQNAPSPPGMVYLRRKLLEDPEGSQLVNPSYKQSGRGCRKEKGKGKKKPRFRPMKWTKQKRRK